MDCEVIVVGGGIGGLVSAALLAARGVDVCLFERQSRVGGCVASISHLGYEFEPTAGLYSGWQDGGIWDRIFSELSLPQPAVTKLSPNFVVRLANGMDIEIPDDRDHFQQNVAAAFPNCADAAIKFFRELDRVHAAENVHTPELSSLFNNTSREFRDFVDVQLQTFAQCTSSECSASRVADALAVARGGLWSINGGGQTLADRLADCLKQSGGRLRLDAPVLRLAYGSDGTPIGIDLLNGERVTARRAIISNLTIWDTYGKLIGLARTPKSISATLKTMSAWGAYLIFLKLDATADIPAPRMLVICERGEAGPYAPDLHQLVVNVAASVTAAPAGQRALTVTTFTRAEDWFSFHEDNESHEQQDQRALETWWARLHSSLPELGDKVEVVETATPQTFYEGTRRRFGMIGSPLSVDPSRTTGTQFPNVFLAGDTISTGIGLEGVARSSYDLANLLTNRPSN